MATERTDRERACDEARRAHVRAAIDQALDNSVSWLVADLLDEPPDVCERWVDAIWNGLRDSLHPEDRLLAILILLEEKIDERAGRLLQDVDP